MLNSIIHCIELRCGIISRDIRETNQSLSMTQSEPPKKVGRPRTATPEKKLLDARARQAKARRKQKTIKVISKRLATEVNPRNRAVWLEFLAWAHDAGEDLLVGVEWEEGGGTLHFSDVASQLIGDTVDRRGMIVEISFI